MVVGQRTEASNPAMSRWKGYLTNGAMLRLSTQFQKDHRVVDGSRDPYRRELWGTRQGETFCS